MNSIREGVCVLTRSWLRARLLLVCETHILDVGTRYDGRMAGSVQIEQSARVISTTQTDERERKNERKKKESPPSSSPNKLE